MLLKLISFFLFFFSLKFFCQNEEEEKEEIRDDSPGGILDRLFTQSNSEIETTMLRCFEYFLNPLLMIEHLTLSYCESARVRFLVSLFFVLFLLKLFVQKQR